MKQSALVMFGHVEYVEGTEDLQYSTDANALRIKARCDSDGECDVMDLPDAFPLIPKLLNVVPKVGEGVFIICAKLGSPNSQRFYIGPIISQPQFNEYSEFKHGRGNAVSLLIDGAKNSKPDPLTAIGRSRQLTKGAFPEPNDVSLIGRGQEDIILKYRGDMDGMQPTSEIDLRAGIRMKPTDNSIKYLQGHVLFNSVNPAYIQIKHKATGLAGFGSGDGDAVTNKYETPEKREATSVVNVVADKINLISHKDKAQFGEKIKNNEQLVVEEEMDNIMSQLHRAVYGDELITLLKLIIDTIKTHTHPFHQMRPTVEGTSLLELQGYNLEKIVSPNVRIS